MQLAQILDFCIESMNQQMRADKKQAATKRKATQADIDAYFGPPRGKK